MDIRSLAPGTLLDVTPSPARTLSRIPAVVSIVLGGALAFAFVGATVGLVRETLHFNCSWNIGGEWGPDGSWACSDGIGYVGVAITLGGMSAILLVVGLLTAIAAPSRRRSLILLALATISLVWVGWWTAYGATLYTGPRPVDELGIDLWAAALLPSLILCALGLLVGGFAVFGARVRSYVAFVCGVGLVLIGTALQPGIGVATLASAGLLAAAGSPRPTA